MEVKITRTQMYKRGVRRPFSWVYDSNIQIVEAHSECIGGYTSLKELKQYLTRRFGQVQFIETWKQDANDTPSR